MIGDTNKWLINSLALACLHYLQMGTESDILLCQGTPSFIASLLHL